MLEFALKYFKVNYTDLRAARIISHRDEYHSDELRYYGHRTFPQRLAIGWLLIDNC